MNEGPHSMNLGIYSFHMSFLSALAERTRTVVSEWPRQIDDALVIPVVHTCSVRETQGQVYLALPVACQLTS